MSKLNRLPQINNINILRGFAIFLVILGHCIQHGSGEEYYINASYYSSILFKSIYGFHMPLFMVISGFLFSISIKKWTTKKLISNRLLLLLPIFVWNFIIHFKQYLSTLLALGFLPFIKEYILSSLYSFWFLWALFYCCMIVLIVHKFFKDSYIIYFLGFILTFFVTDNYCGAASKYLYPFFVLSYLYGNLKSKGIDFKFQSLKNKLLPALFLIYGILIFFYKEKHYIYTSGYIIIGKDPSQIIVNLYRLLVGLIGCILCIIIIQKFHEHFDHNFILFIFSQLGKHSLGLYIIPSILITIIFKEINIPFHNTFLNLLEAIIIVAISYPIVIFIEHFKLSRLILFGKK